MVAVYLDAVAVYLGTVTVYLDAVTVYGVELRTCSVSVACLPPSAPTGDLNNRRSECFVRIITVCLRLVF